ncbi:hypothetical protein [Curtobacterium luteum]|uniref:hypothetical protein n=1 Tax=Curtobacterium luteum TaxID=33881 RepID=UPI00128EE2ED|nr:hypothetical protein [Curtobacterium luteum]
MGRRRRTAGAAVGTSIGVACLATLALTGCTPTTAVDPTATPVAESATAVPGPTAATPSGTSTPRPTSTITPVPGVDDDHGTIPASCAGLITPGKWDDAFASAPLNDPSSIVDPADPPTDRLTPVLQPDGKRLYCIWRDPQADTTFLSIRVAVVDSTKAYPHLQSALKGYDCSLDGYGYRCQKVSQNSQYPVTDGDTYFTRGDVGIHIQQSNVQTSGLLDDVIAHVF